MTDRQLRFSPSTMTEFYPSKEPATDLTRSSSQSIERAMPSFYPSTRQRTLITKHLTAQDDDESDSVYKEAFIIQIFQHWKIKTLEHQQTLNNRDKNSGTDHFTNAHAQTPPSSPIETVQDEALPADNQRPIAGLPKRVTPVPASYVRRKENLKRNLSHSTEVLNPNLLIPHAKAKSSTGSVSSTKKSNKPAPIFIAPKKTQPSLPPRPFSLPSFDEAVQSKRKVALEKQLSAGDEPSTGSVSTWAPTRFAAQSLGTSLVDDDDDGTSSDENRNESLLIRNKKLQKPTTKSRAPVYPSSPVQLNVPTAVLITDPHGNSRVVDFQSNSWYETLDDQSSTLTPSDLYTLHSIGEEEEEHEELNGKEKMDGLILSKELDRIEAFTRSRQPHVDSPMKNLEPESSKVPLGRRWSDGVVSDDDEKMNSSSPTPSLMVKMASTTSVSKQTSASPVKLSRTKYLLMKLHLTSAPSKTEDADLSPSVAAASSSSRKRTVRRSTDKKRYQTH